MSLPPKSSAQSNQSNQHHTTAKQEWNTGPTQQMPTLKPRTQGTHPRPAARTAPLPSQKHAVAPQSIPQTATKPTHTKPADPAHKHHRSRGATCGMIVLGTLIVLLLIGGGVGLWAYSKYQSIAHGIQIAPLPTRDPFQAGNDQQPGANPVVVATPDIVKDPFNILVVGVDIREDAADARTDTIIVVHVNPTGKWASMTSIPRDTCAVIPGFTPRGSCERINAAYEYGYAKAIQERQANPSYGGLTVTAYTVEDLLGIKINHVVQVDFKGFKKIIDAIGGISMNVQKPLIDASYPSDDNDNGFIRLYIPAGYQHMDGTTALRYARSRHQDADYGRSERQQQVIRAIIQTLKAKGLLDQINDLDNLSKQLEGSFFTTLPIDDLGNLRALAGLGSELANGHILSVKWDTESITGYGDEYGYVPIWDPASIQATVNALLAGPTPDTNTPKQTAPEEMPTNNPATDTTMIEVMNGAQIRGLAGDVETHINNLGFLTSGVSTASNVYDTTKIIDFGNHKAERERLAKALGIKSKNILQVSSKNPASEEPTSLETDMILLIGRDYQEAWRQP